MCESSRPEIGSCFHTVWRFSAALNPSNHRKASTYSLLQFAAMLTLNLSHIPDAFVILPPNQSLSGHCDCSGVLINSLILDLGSQAINRDGEGELEVRQRRRRWKVIGKSFWNESHKTAPVCLSYLCTPDSAKMGLHFAGKKQQKKKKVSPQAWTAHSWIFPKNSFFSACNFIRNQNKHQWHREWF